MSFDKTYDPAKYESDIYSKWESSGAFKPSQSHKTPFSIILPPPNANGHIHVGTAMFTIEDIMVRYRRMQGHPTLWLPGMDHAGIETQVVYERVLAERGQSRFDLGREEFFRQVDEFTKSNMAIMISELKSMGFSLDWSKLTYTMDPKVVEIVTDTFKRLHKDGKIYRANRIVNWCPHCRSSFSDIELKYREQLDPLYYIKYGPFVLATVRPETKFGDTAIAVNPKDERYSKWVGKSIEAEDLNGPITLQVIADDYVNPGFGTGVVKVTPAHDPNDWAMGERHQLEVKQAIGTDGLLTELAGRYAGMPVAEARIQVAHDLTERGLMDHIDDSYSHSVAYHDRCGTLIEQLVVEQWWLDVDALKKPAIKAIKGGDIEFVPARFEKQAIDWLENLRDWNISRQNWWGIRVPVFYNATTDASKPEYVIGTEADAVAAYGQGGYEQDTDNFDTWFSSGQWPFATLMAQDEFDRFYPSTVMETGRDLIYLWVTRMIMLGIYRTDEVPFKTVYLHGLVTDGTGKKMSKSRGNVINPLDMTAKYGTDALRLALTIGITPGNDGAISEAKIEGYRNFANKLWNVSRYVASIVGEHKPNEAHPQSAADHWIAAKVASGVAEITKAYDEYRFSDGGQLLYALLWNDFADWYVEASKVEPNPDLLAASLETILKLLHPIAPFVTEAVWQNLPWTNGQLIIADWPHEFAKHDKKKATEFETVQAIVTEARAKTAALGGTKRTLHGKPVNADLVKKLANLAGVKEGSEGLRLNIATGSYYLVASRNEIDDYRHKLEARLKEVGDYAKRLEAQLANQKFVDSAPATIIEQRRDSLSAARAEEAALKSDIASAK